MKDLFTNRLLFGLSLFFVIVSFFPTFYELNERYRLRPERYFELVHNFPTDYNFYLSRIRQGIEGRTTVIEKYTSEPHEGGYIQVLYLFLGWLGRWSRVPWERGGDVYHVARFVFGMTLILLIAQYCKKAFSRSYFQILAFFLAVTASTWPILVWVDPFGWRFGGYMPWWSVMDSLQRITHIPHLILGQALLLFLIMMASDEKVLKKPANWIFLGSLGFLLGIIFPPGLLFFFVTMGIMFWINVIPRLVIGVISAPSLLYLVLMTSFYPWKRLVDVDIIRPLPFEYLEYFKAVGPILITGLVGLVVAIRKKDKVMLPSVAWVITWLFLLLAFKFVPQQSPLRFSEMIPHVPLAVLTAYLFWIIGRKAIILPIMIIVMGIGVMYSSILWQKDFSDTKLMAAYPFVPTRSTVMYPLKDFIRAQKFIQDNTTRDTVILSETTAGNYIPVYSGNRVYVGHDNTVASEAKQVAVKQFFSGQLPQEEARNWLATSGLSVIFFGPQEQEDGGVTDLQRIYPFLDVIYENTMVKVYRYR